MKHFTSKNINFYQLDKGKKIRAEDEPGYLGNIILVAICLVIVTVIVFVINHFYTDSIDVPIYIGFVAIIILSIIIISVPIYTYKNYFKYRKLLNKCRVTNGLITSYDCSRRTRDNKTSYLVNLTYVYYDDNLALRAVLYKKIYNSKPPFFLGQNLLIAFNNSNSLILKKYTITYSDQSRLTNYENTTYHDLFAQIDGQRVNVSRQKLYNYDDADAKILLAIIFLIISIICLLLFSLITSRVLFSGLDEYPQGAKISVIAFISFFFLVFFIGCIHNFITAIKLKKKFKKLLSGRITFTYGLVYRSPKTYSCKSKNTITYIYKNQFEQEFTITKHNQYLCDNTDQPSSILVVYDLDNNSDVIKTYTLVD